jgi:hypothetical protein
MSEVETAAQAAVSTQVRRLARIRTTPPGDPLRLHYVM